MALASAARLLLRDRSAVTALEYGLIAAAVATTIVAAFVTFNTSLTGLFTSLSTHLS